MTRFATLCDSCQARSEEYTAWPSCRECLEYFCDDCALPDSLITGNGEGPDTVVCKKCWRLEHPPRKLTRQERLQGLADSGIDTWADLRGEK